MSIVLQNLERRMAVYNLDAEPHRLVRKFPVEQQLRNGTSVGRMQAKYTPDSLTLLARETRGGLPDTILKCSDIQSALNATPPRLRLVAQTPDPKPQAKPASKKPKAR